MSNLGVKTTIQPTMKCVKCEKEARAVCKFCGRAVCSEHIGSSKYLSGFAPTILSPGQSALIVEDAVWCQICNPEYRNPKAS